jgi:hypothetical protein
VTLKGEKEEWRRSSGIPLSEPTETFIVRSQNDEARFLVLGIELEETNNTIFVHIVDASSKIEILNSIPYSVVSVYQTAIFENKNVPLTNPDNYILQLPYKQRRNFGYELPRLSHEVTVQIELSPQHGWRCPSFSLPDLENNLLERVIEIKGKDSVRKVAIALSFNQATKTIELSLKKRQIFAQVAESQVRCRLKNITLCLIGMQESVRKEILNVCIGGVAFNVYLNDKNIESSLSVQSLRIENALKADPYFVSLFRQAEKS